MLTSYLLRGTHVSHRLYGNGIVQEEWGSWFACRTCYIELPHNQVQCSHCSARRALSTSLDDLLSPHDQPLQVSGKGTYDVLFQDGKIRAINLHWLTVKHGLIAA